MLPRIVLLLDRHQCSAHFNMAIDLVNSTLFDGIIPHLTALEVILQRAFDEPFLPLDATVSEAIKSPAFLQPKRRQPQGI